jgi:ureidoglycolate dehydrogenase (NAD+)
VVRGAWCVVRGAWCVERGAGCGHSSYLKPFWKNIFSGRSKKVLRIDIARLREKSFAIFTAAGISPTDSAMFTDVLLTTDMRGVYSHGVVRSARYIDCLRAGGIKRDAELTLLDDSGSAMRFNANGGLGIPASCKVTQKLIERASTQAISIATLNHSDHYGAAGYYAMLGAEAGLLTLSMSNTIPLIVPPGGKAAAIGNNPFAYAAPGKKHRALCFDICMSKAASGKILIAARDGKTIPQGWILNSAGEPSTDPNDIFRNASMLPFGEHKGYGLALMVELLAGVLAGAGLLSEVHSWNKLPGQDSNTGHCFIAINPQFIGGLDLFRRRVDAVIDELKNTATADGQRVLYPGELEMEKEADARKNGIPLPDASLQELKRAAKMVGIELLTENLLFR